MPCYKDQRWYDFAVLVIPQKRPWKCVRLTRNSTEAKQFQEQLLEYYQMHCGQLLEPAAIVADSSYFRSQQQPLRLAAILAVSSYDSQDDWQVVASAANCAAYRLRCSYNVGSLHGGRQHVCLYGRGSGKA